MQTKIEDTKILKKNIEKWVKALRSGKYQQTRSSLQNDSGYCCLGVACKLFIPKKNLELNYHGLIDGGLPACQLYSPTWLNGINHDVSRQLKTHSLSTLNDMANQYTFDEIADILELLYIHNAIEN